MLGKALLIIAKTKQCCLTDSGGSKSIGGRIHSREEEHFETKTGGQCKPRWGLLLVNNDTWSVTR